MKVTSQKSLLNGEIIIPASKSHTIRAVIIGALVDGESVIYEPLDSLDTGSPLRVSVSGMATPMRFRYYYF